MMTSRFIKHNPVSNAERALTAELGKRGYTLGRQFRTQEQFLLTSADFYFPEQRVAVFLDGPHHLKPKFEKRDELHSQVLGSRGISVLRFSYKPPLSKSQLREIADAIQECVIGNQHINYWEM